MVFWISASSDWWDPMLWWWRIVACLHSWKMSCKSKIWVRGSGPWILDRFFRTSVAIGIWMRVANSIIAWNVVATIQGMCLTFVRSRRRRAPDEGGLSPSREPWCAHLLFGDKNRRNFLIAQFELQLNYCKYFPFNIWLGVKFRLSLSVGKLPTRQCTIVKHKIKLRDCNW